ncbi:AMP-binding protein [Sneathiella sp. P13V-1]|uniref:acyl-CoA synthetase n=1 Tax=Sneathiella sp. P13V-1 TaxID=2697366 RepID=UPI00187BB584|nr:acyl-CoA synthetase [Sneathiella sp. P13V-1]MBE7637495.1 AMP-binding protein [Sneathiella sp. P13V-1]
MPLNIAELNEAIADALPDREAIVFGKRRITFAEFNDRTRRLANLLLDHGITVHAERENLQNWQSGQDHVGLYMYNCNEYPEGILGCLKARAVPININYRYVEEELIYVMRDAGLKALIFHGCFADKVDAIRHQLPDLKLLIQVEDGSNTPLLEGAIAYEDALTSSSSEKPDVIPSPDDLYVIYTGGTTGMPKGVLWRQCDFLPSVLGGRHDDGSPIEDIGTFIDKAVNSKSSSSLAAPPYMHGTGQIVSFVAWHNGNTVVLQDNMTHMDPAELMEVAEREKVKTIAIVGDAFARPIADEIERKKYDLSSWRLMVSSGAIFSTSVKNRLLAKNPKLTIIDAFGSSETGAHGHNVASGNIDDKTSKFEFSPNGVALNQGKTALATSEDESLGWFAVKGNIPLGYLNDEQKTNETFPVVDGVRYSIPGDRVRLDPDGVMNFMGRDSVTINSGGEKIFAEEVEQAILHHPEVQDVVVSSRPSERWGNEVVAIVQARNGKTPSDQSLLKTAEQHIARYKLPKAIIRVEKVKRGENGKMDYRWAKEIASSLQEISHAT